MFSRKLFCLFLSLLLPILVLSLNSTDTVGHKASFPANLTSPLDRREFIRNLTLETWTAYQKYAWAQGALPLVNGSLSFAVHTFDNSGRTILSALPTLWIMGHREEYETARTWILDRLDFADNPSINRTLPTLFEEYIGSLLSAYALTADRDLLRVALQTATLIAPGKTLSDLFFVGNEKLGKVGDLTKVETRLNELYEQTRNLNFSSVNQTATERVDSLIEHLILESRMRHQLSYSQGSSPSSHLLEQFNSTIGTLAQSDGSVWTYVNRSNWRFMRLSDCRLGAALANLASTVRNETLKREILQFGKGTAEVCHAMTLATPTGLPKTSFYIEKNETTKGKGGNSFWVLPVIDGQPYNLEADLLETYFILYRRTGEEVYREYAWQYVLALYENLRFKEGAFFGEIDANTRNSQNQTVQHQSPIFFSGTLKYLYLIFTEPWILPLDKWAFDAIGNPLPIRGANPAFPVV